MKPWLGMSARRSFVVSIAAVTVAVSSTWIWKRPPHVASSVPLQVNQDVTPTVTAHRSQEAMIHPAAGSESEALTKWRKLWDQHQDLRHDPFALSDAKKNVFLPVLVALIDEGRGSEAAKLVEASPEGIAASQLTVQFAAKWAAVDPEAAVAWFASIADSIGRANAMGGIIDTFSKAAPDEAISFVRGITDPEDQRSASIALVNGLVSSGREPAAFQFVQGLDGSLAADRARKEFVEDALLRDPSQTDALKVLSQIVDKPIRKQTTDEALRLVGK